MIMAEALNNGQIPGLGDASILAEKGRVERKCKELQMQFNDLRKNYLTELTQYRDQKRDRLWNTYMQEGMDELLPPEEPMYRYCPESAMDPDVRQYFTEATQELVKLAMIKGAMAEQKRLKDLGMMAGLEMDE